MWKLPHYKRFRRGSKVFPALCVMLALSCCVLPCYAQASPSTTSASWADFEQIIQDFKTEIANLKQEKQNAIDSLTLSAQEKATLIVDYDRRLSEKDQQLIEWKQKYERLRNGADATESLKNELYRDLKASERLNAILIIAEIASLIGLGFAVAR